MNQTLTKSFPGFGLLTLRLGLGVMFILHGTPKITGGPDLWVNLGGAMGNIGITFAPTFWGFMAAFAEFGGGILLVLGLLTRPAALMMAFTMMIATVMHLTSGDDFMHVASRPLELLFAFVAIALLGGGRFSLDNKLFNQR
jgi:putative oxidoreductase